MLGKTARSGHDICHKADDFWPSGWLTLTALPPHCASLSLEFPDASLLSFALLSIPYLSLYFTSLSMVSKM